MPLGVAGQTGSHDAAIRRDEIEPLVVSTVSTYFSRYNHDVIRNPKVTVRVDDARHYLTTTKEKFDAIISICMMDHLCSPEEARKGKAVDIYREYFKKCRAETSP